MDAQNKGKPPAHFSGGIDMSRIRSWKTLLLLLAGLVATMAVACGTETVEVIKAGVARPAHTKGIHRHRIGALRV